MRVSPIRGHPKFNLFTLLTWTYEIFKVSKYKRAITSNNLRLPKWDAPLKRGHQNSNFVTIHTGAVRNKKRGGLNFFVMIKAYENWKVFI